MSDRFLFDTDGVVGRCTTALTCQIGAQGRYTTCCPCTVQKRTEFCRLTLTASGDGSRPGPLKKSPFKHRSSSLLQELGSFSQLAYRLKSFPTF